MWISAGVSSRLLFPVSTIFLPAPFSVLIRVEKLELLDCEALSLSGAAAGKPWLLDKIWKLHLHHNVSSWTQRHISSLELLCGLLLWTVGYLFVWASGQFKISAWTWIFIPATISQTACSSAEGLDLLVCQICLWIIDGKYLNLCWMIVCLLSSLV